MTTKLAALLVLFSAVPSFAVDAPKNIVFTKNSNVPPADILKALHGSCPSVSITDDAAKGDYTLEAVNKPNPVTNDGMFDLTLSDRDGKTLRKTSTLSLGGAVKDICNAIKTGVVVEIVDSRTLTQSVDVRGTGSALVPAVVNATTGRRTHTDTDTIYVIVNGEHALLDCYERRKGCSTIAPGKYYGELEGGSLWVNYEMPLTHQPLRNHYKVAGSW